MPFHTYMGWPGPVTARQHDMVQEWLGMQWNRPSRGDHYLMSVVHEVLKVPFRVWGQKEPRLKLDDFKLKFGAEEATVDKSKVKRVPKMSEMMTPEETIPDDLGLEGEERSGQEVSEARKREIAETQAVWAARLGVVPGKK